MVQEISGGQLLRLLRLRQHIDGITVSELAQRLEVSQPYLSQLLGGRRSLDAASDAFLRKCADLLGMSVAMCFLIAGRFRMSDFFPPSPSFATALLYAIKQVEKSSSAMATGIKPGDLQALPISVQQLLVVLHERGEGECLLPERLSAEAIAAVGRGDIPFEVRVVRPK